MRKIRILILTMCFFLMFALVASAQPDLVDPGETELSNDLWSVIQAGNFTQSSLASPGRTDKSISVTGSNMAFGNHLLYQNKTNLPMRNSGTYVYQVDWYIDDMPAEDMMYIQLFAGTTSSDYYVFLTFFGDGRITTGNSYAQVSSYEQDTWYTNKIEINYDTGDYTVYVKKDGEAFRSLVSGKVADITTNSFGDKVATNGIARMRVAYTCQNRSGNETVSVRFDNTAVYKTPSIQTPVIEGTGYPLTARYTMVDSLAKDSSEIIWYYSEYEEGPYDIMPITEKSFIVPEEYAGKWVKLGVIPKETTDTSLVYYGEEGKEYLSQPIKIDSVMPPMAENVYIEDKTYSEGDTVKGEYTYNGSTERNEDIYRWYISDTETGQYSLIENESERTLVISDEMAGKYIQFEVIPNDEGGIAMTSNAVYVQPLLTFSISDSSAIPNDRVTLIFNYNLDLVDISKFSIGDFSFDYYSINGKELTLFLQSSVLEYMQTYTLQIQENAVISEINQGNRATSQDVTVCLPPGLNAFNIKIEDINGNEINNIKNGIVSVKVNVSNGDAEKEITIVGKHIRNGNVIKTASLTCLIGQNHISIFNFGTKITDDSCEYIEFRLYEDEIECIDPIIVGAVG